MKPQTPRSRGVEWILGALILFGVFYFFSYNKNQKKPPVTEETVNEEASIENSSSDSSSLPAKSLDTKTPQLTTASTLGSEEATWASRNMNLLLDQVASCLSVGSNQFSEGTSANRANFLASFQSSLGEPTFQYEDWSNYFLRLENGELRKIRLESSTEVDGLSGKFLKYYAIEQGQEKFIPLSQEQSINPGEAAIEDLKKQGAFVKEQKSSRFYFQNTEEINLIETNGVITGLDMLRENKSLRCTGVATAKMTCDCN